MNATALARVPRHGAVRPYITPLWMGGAAPRRAQFAVLTVLQQVALFYALSNSAVIARTVDLPQHSRVVGTNQCLCAGRHSAQYTPWRQTTCCSSGWPCSHQQQRGLPDSTGRSVSMASLGQQVTLVSRRGARPKGSFVVTYGQAECHSRYCGSATKRVS
jgi:hypothetical protein